MRRLLLIIGLSVLLVHAEAAPQDTLKKVSFEDIERLQKIQRRHVLVFIKTSWCSYCKAMEETVFKHPEVIEELNKKFYSVFLNAESRRKIHFSGRLFSFKPTGENTGIHELAEELAAVEGKVSYPAICVINAENEIIFQYQGVLNRQELLKVLALLPPSEK